MTTVALRQIVYAKLKGSGAFAVAAHTSEMDSAEAMDAVMRSGVGDPPLEHVERCTALLTQDKQLAIGLSGPRLFSVATPGPWPDQFGRPWTYRRIVYVPESDLQDITHDIFFLANQLSEVTDFEETTVIERVSVVLPSEVERRTAWRATLDRAQSFPQFERALLSVLSGRAVTWVMTANPEPLLQAALAALPPTLRARVTFATLAASPPKLTAQVLICQVLTPALMSENRALIEIDREIGMIASEDVDCRDVSASIAGWVRSGEIDELEEWQGKAEQFMRRVPNGGSWVELLSELRASLAWVKRPAEARLHFNANEPRVLRLADGYQPKSTDMDARGFSPPVDVLWAELAPSGELSEATSPHRIADAVASARRDNSDAEWRRLMTMITRALLKQPFDISRFALVLSDVERSTKDAPGIMVAEALEELWQCNRTDEALELADAMSEGRLWSSIVVRSMRKLGERMPPSGIWAVDRVLPLGFYFGTDEVDLPTVQWVERLVAHGLHAPGLTEAARRVLKRIAAVSIPSASVDSIERLAAEADQQDERGVSLVATVLLSLVVRPPAMLTSAQVVDAVRRAAALLVSPSKLTSQALRWGALTLLVLEVEDDSQSVLAVMDPSCLTRTWLIAHALVDESKKATSVSWRPVGLVLAGPAAVEASANEADTSTVARRLNVMLSRPMPDDSQFNAELIGSLARLMSGRDTSHFDGKARGLVLLWAIRIASRDDDSGQRLARWARSLIRRGTRLPEGYTISVGTSEMRASCAHVVCEVGEPLLEHRDWTSFSASVARMIGDDARSLWFGHCVHVVGRYAELLAVMCDVSSKTSPHRPIEATARLREATRIGELSISLRSALARLLPRARFGLRKIGFR